MTEAQRFMQIEKHQRMFRAELNKADAVPVVSIGYGKKNGEEHVVVMVNSNIEVAEVVSCLLAAADGLNKHAESLTSKDNKKTERG